MLKRIVLLIALAFTFTSQAFSADGMHAYKSAKILSKRNVSGVGAVLSLRMPKTIPLKYWAVCDYYDKDSEVIASINHVMHTRVTEWVVRVDADDVYFVLCAVPN